MRTFTEAEIARFRHLAGLPDPDEAEVLDPPVLYGLLTESDVAELERRRSMVEFTAKHPRKSRRGLRVVA